VTRHREDGAYRNLIGLKVSDDMLAAITADRGETPVQDYIRGLISDAVEVPGVGTDWERRARDAERKLEAAREALGRG
jgi:hypothetical protein